MMLILNLVIAIALSLLPLGASPDPMRYMPLPQDLPDGMILSKTHLGADMAFMSWIASIPGPILKVSALAVLSPTENEAEANLRELIKTAEGWEIDAKCGWPLGPRVVCFNYKDEAQGYEGYGVAVVEGKMMWALTIIATPNSGGEKWLANLSRTIYDRTHQCPPKLCTSA